MELDHAGCLSDSHRGQCYDWSQLSVLAPLHPLDPQERNSGVEYGKPITIGDNFWAGGGVIVLLGVTLGNNVVAGAGAVITKSFGDNVVLAGNPARVIKEISVK